MKELTEHTPAALSELKVAIYIRVSTQYQVDRASLPVQREELINYAKYVLGIESYVVFEDAGYSAKNIDRPDYQQMMARVRTGEFTHILVWKIDQLEAVDARLDEIEASSVASLSLSDEEFMAKASYFILTQQLQDKRFVDYEKFIRKIDPQIVKDFLNSIVTNFCIKDGLTTSILFRNGLEIRFSYKTSC